MKRRVLYSNWILAIFLGSTVACSAGQGFNSEAAVANAETIVAECTGDYADATDYGYQAGVVFVTRAWELAKDCKYLSQIEEGCAQHLSNLNCDRANDQKEQCTCLGHHQGVNDTLAALKKQCGDTSSVPGTEPTEPTVPAECTAEATQYGYDSGVALVDAIERYATCASLPELEQTLTEHLGRLDCDQNADQTEKCKCLGHVQGVKDELAKLKVECGDTGTGEPGTSDPGTGEPGTGNSQTCATNYPDDYNCGTTVGRQFADQAWKGCDSVTEYQNVVSAVLSAPVIPVGEQISQACQCRIDGLRDGLAAEAQVLTRQCNN